MMIIDFEIAFGPYVNVEEAMAAEGVKHMIEKRHAGFDRRLSAPVDLQMDFDISFFGFSFNLSRPPHDTLHSLRDCASFSLAHHI
jgi:hypothetical protein